MHLNRIRKISQSNIDRLIKENLYRGFTKNNGTVIVVQCMDKDFFITFDFVQEEAVIESSNMIRVVDICDTATNSLHRKIKLATC